MFEKLYIEVEKVQDLNLREISLLLKEDIEMLLSISRKMSESVSLISKITNRRHITMAEIISLKGTPLSRDIEILDYIKLHPGIIRSELNKKFPTGIVRSSIKKLYNEEKIIKKLGRRNTMPLFYNENCKFCEKKQGGTTLKE